MLRKTPFFHIKSLHTFVLKKKPKKKKKKKNKLLLNQKKKKPKKKKKKNRQFIARPKQKNISYLLAYFCATKTAMHPNKNPTNRPTMRQITVIVLKLLPAFFAGLPIKKIEQIWLHVIGGLLSTRVRVSL